MNQINKIRHLISKSKLFKTSTKYYNTKNVMLEHKNAIIVGTSFTGVSLICYYFLDGKMPNIFQKSYCDTAIFHDKPKVVYKWTNMPEFVKKDEHLKTEESVNDPLVDSVNASKEDADVKEITKSELPVYMTEAQDGHIVSIPSEVPYLIIGAGIAGMSAARAIRASDPLAKVLIINSECQSPGAHKETYPPYRRILLSKFIWRRSEEHQKTMLDPTGDVKSSSLLFLEPESFFVPLENLSRLPYGGISLLNGVRVGSIDPADHSVILDGSGHKITYQACLIATGSYPKRLMHLETSKNTGTDLYEQGKVSYFRSLNDFRNLSEIVRHLQKREGGGARVLVLGGGLLGTELAASLGRLAKNQGDGLEVLSVFREPSHLWHILPSSLSRYVQRHLARVGRVTMVPHTEVVGIEEVIESGRLRISLREVVGDEQQAETGVQEVDHVVIAAGVRPDTSLSVDGNLETDPMLGGFVVNAEMRARGAVFVAGDAASFHDPLLGRRRVAHWDHAEEGGAVAGHNMAALVLANSGRTATEDMERLANDVRKPKVYTYQTGFSFKLGAYTGLEAVGLVDSEALETRTFVAKAFYEDGEEENGGDQVTLGKPEEPLDMPGVVFYLRNKRLVGVLLWNCDDDLVVDSDFPSPLRSNVARRLLAERRVITDEDQLRTIAADFDLSFFVNSQIKFLDDYSKKRREQEKKTADVESQK